MPSLAATVMNLEEFVARGQRAQKAVDKIIASDTIKRCHKTVYLDEATAKRKAAHSSANSGYSHRYYCPTCRGWHLGKQPR
jgi:hypothetical protein